MIHPVLPHRSPLKGCSAMVLAERHSVSNEFFTRDCIVVSGCCLVAFSVSGKHRDIRVRPRPILEANWERELKP